MKRLVIASWFSALGLCTVGCSSDGRFGGQYESPADFTDRSGCIPGSLQGFSREAVWRTDDQPGLAGRTLVTSRSGNSLLIKTNGWQAPARIGPDDLFVRYVDAEYGDSLYALDICGVRPDGVLVGWVVSCYEYCREYSEPRPISFRPIDPIQGETTSSGLELLSGSIDRPAYLTLGAIRAVAGRVYAADWDGISISELDGSGKLKPLRSLGRKPNSLFAPGDLEIVTDAAGDEFVLVADYDSFEIYDSSKADDKAYVAGLVGSLGPGYRMAIQHRPDRVLAVMAARGGLDFYDVTEPSRAFVAGSWVSDGFGEITDVQVVGDLAYLSSQQGVVALDITKLDSVSGVKAESDGASSYLLAVTEVAGKRVVVSASTRPYPMVRVLDGDPASPSFLELLSSWSTRDTDHSWVLPHDLEVSGSNLYLGYGEDGVRVIDISDPLQPQQKAYYHTMDLDPSTATGEDSGLTTQLEVDPGSGLIIARVQPFSLLTLRLE